MDLKKRRKVIKRATIFTIGIYIILNGFICGMLKAYLKSHNAVSKDQLVAAVYTENDNKADLKILDKNFVLDKGIVKDTKICMAAYTLMPDRTKAALEIILHMDRLLDGQ